MSQGETESGSRPIQFEGKEYKVSPGNHWKAKPEGMSRLAERGRLLGIGKTLVFKRYIDDFP
jgi:adenine-specific DNA-methyltransferase